MDEATETLWDKNLIVCDCSRTLYDDEEVLNHIFEHLEEWEDKKVILRVKKRQSAT